MTRRDDLYDRRFRLYSSLIEVCDCFGTHPAFLDSNITRTTKAITEAREQLAHARFLLPIRKAPFVTKLMSLAEDTYGRAEKLRANDAEQVISPDLHAKKRGAIEDRCDEIWAMKGEVCAIFENMLRLPDDVIEPDSWPMAMSKKVYQYIKADFLQMIKLFRE